jgi:S-adenosylmethionine/arginine decarboxylase-like enzyme
MPCPALWGKSASIDLYDCNQKTISDPKLIKRFIRQIIPLLKMKAHGPTIIERFGSGKLEGWSAMQFIETSSITLHADETHNRCFIDIFSCKDFNPAFAESFARKFFAATSYKSVVLTR